MRMDVNHDSELRMGAAAADRKRGLRLDGVVKRFGSNTVLHDLSLSVSEGELLSLLGPSGCGKTTTLNLIAGFDRPDAGSMWLNGENITSLPPNKRDTTIVFQNYALFPHMTVANNVGYGLRARKVPKDEILTRVSRMLDLLSIGQLADRYPGQLSGGQQQRVALARAVAVRPSLLLLDEPLSNLDAKLRQEVRVQIRNLQQELNQTAVFVTHDQEEALAISDKIAVLNHGWLEQLGTPEELWENPSSVYVASFMGVENIIPIHRDGNLIRADLAGTNRNIELRDVDERYSHLGFRPSSGRIVEDADDPGEGSLLLRGTVLSKTYLGSSFLYVCDIGDTTVSRITVEQTQHDRQFNVGASANIEVPRNEIHHLVDSAVAAAS